MKNARPPKRKAVRAPRDQNSGKDGSATKKTSRNCQQPRGGVPHSLADKIQHSSPSSSTEAFPQQLLVKGTHSLQTRTELPVLELYPKQTLCNPSAKIKLQLFPIDGSTRLGLEKDGHNPYLELTLRAQKKLSSVLKHLDSKWGCSSIAHGELILFPYKMPENFRISGGWTLNDSDISAGDVYAAIGSPAVFRLRYGWFSDSDTRTTVLPASSTCFESYLRPEEMEERLSSKLAGTHSKKPVEERSEEFKPINTIEETNAAVAETILSVEPVDSVDEEVKLDSHLGQPSSFWDDSLTNISIGGLLSEASMHGRINNCDPKSSESHVGSQFISDSFDAFIAAHLNQSQAPRLPQDLRSSILDAENTCHAFPSRKPSTSTKDIMALRGSAFSGGCNQDISSKSFKFPKRFEINSQSGLPQGQACQGSETDLLLCSRGYNEESSLWLRGIKWNDSLGPFDLGMSSGKSTEGGDGISLTGFVR